MKVIIPGNTQVYESELATYWFDAQGILNAMIKKRSKSLQNIRINLDLLKKLATDKKNRLLIYLNYSAYLNKESRKLVAAELPRISAAVALVAGNNVSKKLINAFFKLKRPIVPMKTFTNDSEARQWLKQFA